MLLACKYPQDQCIVRSVDHEYKNQAETKYNDTDKNRDRDREGGGKREKNERMKEGGKREGGGAHEDDE